MTAPDKASDAVAYGKLAHTERDADGKSVLAMRNNAAMHADKDREGRSIVAVLAGTASMAERDSSGRSVNGQRAARAAIAPEVESRRAVTRRRKMLDRTHDEMLAHAEGMSERGAAAQIGFHAEVHRQLTRGEIDSQGNLI